MEEDTETNLLLLLLPILLPNPAEEDTNLLLPVATNHLRSKYSEEEEADTNSRRQSEVTEEVLLPPVRL